MNPRTKKVFFSSLIVGVVFYYNNQKYRKINNFQGEREVDTIPVTFEMNTLVEIDV